MRVLGRWRKHLFGTQEKNPQIGRLLSLNKHPGGKSVDGEEDSRWNAFADDVQRAVADLDADFFQDLADAARELKAGHSIRSEAIHYATLLVNDAEREGKSPAEIVKGEIREQIEEIWANEISGNVDGPTEEDKARAKKKSESVRWPDVYKAAGIEDATRKPKKRKRIG